MSGRRLGVFGGTFDPPHLGHLIVASDAFDHLRLDRLLFVPAAEPPHKPGYVRATGDQRLRMTRAALRDDDRFAAEDLELRRGGVSYTVDTLRELRERDPDAELVFLLGADQFREMSSWREPAEIVRLARLGVLARAGNAPTGPGDFPASQVPVTRIDISSTEIRDRARTGRSIRYLVPEPVRTIIERERIYAR